MKQPLEVREQVEEVSVDMWGGFPNFIKKVFPNAQIVIDRFHVMKVVNRDLNKLRRAAGITDIAILNHYPYREHKCDFPKIHP